MLKMQKWKNWSCLHLSNSCHHWGRTNFRACDNVFWWAIGTLETYTFTWGGAHLFSQPVCMIRYDNRASVLMGTLSLHPHCWEILPFVMPVQGPTHRIMLELICYSFHILILVREVDKSKFSMVFWFQKSFSNLQELRICPASPSCWLFKDYAE